MFRSLPKDLLKYFMFKEELKDEFEPGLYANIARLVFLNEQLLWKIFPEKNR